MKRTVVLLVSTMMLAFVVGGCSQPNPVSTVSVDPSVVGMTFGEAEDLITSEFPDSHVLAQRPDLSLVRHGDSCGQESFPMEDAKVTAIFNVIASSVTLEVDCPRYAAASQGTSPPQEPLNLEDFKWATDGEVQLTSGADMVPIKAGEIQYSGTSDSTVHVGFGPTLSDGKIDVGFILSADQSEIHNLTLTVGSIKLKPDLNVRSVTHTARGSLAVSNNAVTVHIEDVADLILKFSKGVFSGEISYHAQLQGSDVDLGTGSLTCSPVAP